MPRLAVIGLGGRISGMLATMRELDPEISIAAVADPRIDEKRLETLGAGAAKRFASVAALIAEGGRYDGYVVGTRCDLHADVACAVAPLGAPLFLEKPVAITDDQATRLAAAWRGREDQVVVSFPLSSTPLFRAVHEVVRSGRLGQVNQIQAFNYVTYGGVYFGQWYRDHDLTGGLWLQKATHDFAYLVLLAAAEPVAVAAVGTRLVFGGDMPPELTCSTCDRTATCPESPVNQAARGDNGGMGAGDHACAFSSSIRNDDASSALIVFANGLHVAYSQNFVSRRSAGARGARITGHRATLEFDWYRDAFTVTDHFDHRVDRVEVKPAGGHSGGDSQLARDFIAVVRGGRSHTDLHAGLQSARLCLAARTSAQTHTFQTIAGAAAVPAVAARR
ncbi:MAG TPA: Gfo/Idh/MocA family oxidoreductase [Planctomycetota bacterium]|nr:Gfo/Idh/MocA family oxidoreductase [Planctomycetota bacterium]